MRSGFSSAELRALGQIRIRKRHINRLDADLFAQLRQAGSLSYCGLPARNYPYERRTQVEERSQYRER